MWFCFMPESIQTDYLGIYLYECWTRTRCLV